MAQNRGDDGAGNGESDPPVLSYHDSLLRQSDVALLTDNRWLNDSIIGFAFEYFERETFKEFVKDVAFIGPQVTQFIKMECGDDLDIFLDPLALSTKKYVFLVVNNNSSANRPGGTHWSLLAYNRKLNAFHHYDTLGGANAESAQVISHAIEIFLRAPRKVTYDEAASPQQQNFSDCGLFVICNAEHVFRVWSQDDQRPLLDLVDTQYVQDKRRALKQLIESLVAS